MHDFALMLPLGMLVLEGRLFSVAKFSSVCVNSLCVHYYALMLVMGAHLVSPGFVEVAKRLCRPPKFRILAFLHCVPLPLLISKCGRDFVGTLIIPFSLSEHALLSKLSLQAENEALRELLLEQAPDKAAVMARLNKVRKKKRKGIHGGKTVFGVRTAIFLMFYEESCCWSRHRIRRQ